MKGGKLILVILGALVITALGIDAADTVTGSRSTLLASLLQPSTPSACPTGMVPLKKNSNVICVDIYEASTDPACPISNPSSLEDTLTDLSSKGCKAVSKSGVLPWRYVPYRTAEQLCARAGKSLITPDIWYQAALGTSDTKSSCPVDQELQLTGERGNCVSGSGVFDMIGNVWELVAGEVNDRHLSGTLLPITGYVAAINDAGLPTATAGIPNKIYNADYFWSEATGTYATMRGGYYGGRSDAGIYSTQAALNEDFSGAAVGFRCMLAL